MGEGCQDHAWNLGMRILNATCYVKNIIVMLFPERLRQLRTQSGMKQREVAQALGIDIPMYSRYEHGERRPKREQVVKIAKLFHADANELIALWLAFNAINEILRFGRKVW